MNSSNEDLRESRVASVVAGQLAAEASFIDLKKLLDSHGIRVLVLKGPHLGAIAYDDPSERGYTDLDLLVPASRQEEAANLLLTIGYKTLGSPAGRYIMSLESPQGWPVELHRAFEAYHMFRIDYDSLFQRADTFAFGGINALGLAREDLLLHLVIHAAKSLFREISHKHVIDVAMLARQCIRWDVFVTRAAEVRCLTASWILLSAATDCCSANIPEKVLVQLQPGWSRRTWLKFWLRFGGFPLFYREYLPNWTGRLVVLPAIFDRLGDGFMSGLRFWLTRVRDVTKSH